jgi:hypothetical protein
MSAQDAEKTNGGEIAMDCFEDIPPEMPEWLWEGRIPYGFPTLVAGDGGIGKGYLMCDLAARVTRGAGAAPGPISMTCGT